MLYLLRIFVEVRVSAPDTKYLNTKSRHMWNKVCLMTDLRESFRGLSPKFIPWNLRPLELSFSSQKADVSYRQWGCRSTRLCALAGCQLASTQPSRLNVGALDRAKLAYFKWFILTEHLDFCPVVLPTICLSYSLLSSLAVSSRWSSCSCAAWCVTAKWL